MKRTQGHVTLTIFQQQCRCEGGGEYVYMLCITGVFESGVLIGRQNIGNKKFNKYAKSKEVCKLQITITSTGML